MNNDISVVLSNNNETKTDIKRTTDDYYDLDMFILKDVKLSNNKQHQENRSFSKDAFEYTESEDYNIIMKDENNIILRESQVDINYSLLKENNFRIYDTYKEITKSKRAKDLELNKEINTFTGKDRTLLNDKTDKDFCSTEISKSKDRQLRISLEKQHINLITYLGSEPKNLSLEFENVSSFEFLNSKNKQKKACGVSCVYKIESNKQSLLITKLKTKVVRLMKSITELKDRNFSVSNELKILKTSTNEEINSLKAINSKCLEKIEENMLLLDQSDTEINRLKEEINESNNKLLANEKMNKENDKILLYSLRFNKDFMEKLETLLLKLDKDNIIYLEIEELMSKVRILQSVLNKN